MKYRLASHPHQNKRSFPKKPASGGRPPRDKRYRAKERAKKGSLSSYCACNICSQYIGCTFNYAINIRS